MLLNSVSVIIPLMRCQFIKYLLPSLLNQSYPYHEVIFIIKNLDAKFIEKLCSRYSLTKSMIILQKEGGFTSALNLGIKNASGDLLLFTDDDAFLPRSWIKKYIKLHRIFNKAGAICSRDFILYEKDGHFKLMPSQEDLLHRKLYHWFFMSLLHPPHPYFTKYRLGIYLTKHYTINYGLYFPGKTCLSLLFRGVNMSFKREALNNHKFPEHPLIKRGLGNEQYISIALILDGWEVYYTPENPVFHFWKEESLSRYKFKGKDILIEKRLMKNLVINLVKKADVQKC